MGKVVKLEKGASKSGRSRARSRSQSRTALVLGGVFGMLTQQLAAACTNPPNQSGCIFADMSELEVYGRPS